MGGGKKLLVLLGILAALGAFVYFYEIRGKEERDKQESEQSKLVVLNLDSTSRVALVRRNEPPVTLEKSSGKWRLTQPVQADADAAAVQGLLQALADSSSARTLEKPDLSRYGLKDPTVTVTLNDSGKSHTIRLGDKDFSGGSVYAMRDSDPNVFLVLDNVFVKATQSLTELRDKTILEFDSDAVAQIEIRRKTETLLMKKEKEGWELRQPAGGRADSVAVDGLLNSVRYGRVQTFAQESLNELKKYGLDPPAARVVLTSGDKKAELNLGEKTGENYYAYVPGRTVVFTVDKDVFDKATQPVDQFQSREVVRFDRDKVKKIEASGEKGKWVAEKQGTQWKLISPAIQGKKTFAEYQVFTALEDLKAEKVLQPGSMSLGTAFASCRLSGEGTPIQVEIFKKGSDWYARSSQSENIFKISGTQAQALNEPADHFLQ